MTNRRERTKGDLHPGTRMRKRQTPPPACPQERSPGWARVPLREQTSRRRGLQENPEKTFPPVARQAPIVGRPGPQIPQFGTRAKLAYWGERKLWKLPRCGNRGKLSPLCAYRFGSGGLSTVPTALGKLLRTEFPTVPTASAAAHIQMNLCFGTALALPWKNPKRFSHRMPPAREEKSKAALEIRRTNFYRTKDEHVQVPPEPAFLLTGEGS